VRHDAQVRHPRHPERLVDLVRQEQAVQLVEGRAIFRQGVPLRPAPQRAEHLVELVMGGLWAGDALRLSDGGDVPVEEATPVDEHEHVPAEDEVLKHAVAGAEPLAERVGDDPRLPLRGDGEPVRHGAAVLKGAPGLLKRERLRLLGEGVQHATEAEPAPPGRVLIKGLAGRAERAREQLGVARRDPPRAFHMEINDAINDGQEAFEQRSLDALRGARIRVGREQLQRERRSAGAVGHRTSPVRRALAGPEHGPLIEREHVERLELELLGGHEGLLKKVLAGVEDLVLSQLHDEAAPEELQADALLGCCQGLGAEEQGLGATDEL